MCCNSSIKYWMLFSFRNFLILSIKGMKLNFSRSSEFKVKNFLTSALVSSLMVKAGMWLSDSHNCANMMKPVNSMMVSYTVAIWPKRGKPIWSKNTNPLSATGSGTNSFRTCSLTGCGRHLNTASLLSNKLTVPP